MLMYLVCNRLSHRGEHQRLKTEAGEIGREIVFGGLENITFGLGRNRESAETAHGHRARLAELMDKRLHTLAYPLAGGLVSDGIATRHTACQQAVVKGQLAVEAETAHGGQQPVPILDAGLIPVDKKRAETRHDDAIVTEQKILDMQSQGIHNAKLIKTIVNSKPANRFFCRKLSPFRFYRKNFGGGL